jgi:hypothetical protein
VTSLKNRATTCVVLAAAAIGSLGFAFHSAAYADDNAPAPPASAKLCAAYKQMYDTYVDTGPILSGVAANIKETARLRGCDTSAWRVLRLPSIIGGVAAPPVNGGLVPVMP